jgi:MFS transporter, PPP family, 3-phenylpropionic acid transporter
MTRNFFDKAWQFSFYFLFFAGAVGVFNFLALYLQAQGLVGSQIGTLMAVASLVGLLSGPLLSGLADSSQRHRLILALAILGNGLAFSIFPFLHTFGWLLVMIVVESLFGGPMLSMADNATLSMLGEERALYGRIRLGGTVGWGAAAPLMGLIVEHFGIQSTFWIYAGALLIGLLAVRRMRFSPKAAQGSFLQGVRQLLSDRRWIVFLLIAFAAGIGNAAITSYLFLYLQKIGASPTSMGLAITISTVVEVPALYFANHFIKRLGSRGLLTLGLVGVAVRCMLYGLVSVTWAALLIQLLQFVTFPILWVAGVSYADENSPAGMGATAQSIFGAAFQGFGSAAGGFLGGVMLQYFGVQRMFLMFGILIMAAALIYGVAQRTLLVRQVA